MGIFGGGIFNKISEGYNTVKASREEAFKTKLYATFQIPDAEEILSSHVHTMLGNITDGVVVTRSALHLHAKHQDEHGSTCIPYTHICEYIAFQVGPRDPVILYRYDGTAREILEGTLIDGKIGPELVKTIQNVQQQLKCRDSDCRAQFDRVAQHAIEEGQNTVRHNGLSPELLCILLYLRESDTHRKKALQIVAQDHAQRFSKSDYERWMSNLCGEENTALYQELLALRETFVATFVQDMQDLSFEMDRFRLGNISDKLSQEADSGFSKFALGVLAVRGLRFKEAERCALALEQKGNQAQAQKLRFLSCIHRNQIMKEVFEALRRGEEIEQAYLNISDGFGLTALHYAMILDNSDTVCNVLEQKKWMKADTDQSYLDYIDLAMLRRDRQYAMVFIMQTKVARKFLRRGKMNQALATGVDIGEKVLDALIVASHATRNDSLDDEEWDDYTWDASDEEQNGNELMQLSPGVACELGDMLRAAIGELDRKWQEELLEYVTDRIQVAEWKIAQWKSGKSPLFAYLLKLYTNPDYLYEVLCSDASCFALFRRENYYFIAPADMETMIWEEEASNDSAKETIERPYGNSWFSPEARTDMQLLKKEYRALVKKYHPDVCVLSNSTEIIQEIFNEYSEVLSTIKQE